MYIFVIHNLYRYKAENYFSFNNKLFKMKKNALYKGTLQNIVLKLLAKEVKMYGYQITQRAKEITKGELEMTEGALYPILHKLENEGIIFSEMQNVNGRDRKYYLLTEKGKKQQATQEAEMKSYLFNLNAIFNI